MKCSLSCLCIQFSIYHDKKISIYHEKKILYTRIPDKNFEQALIDKGYDDTIDGQVLTSNISSITELDLVRANISDLTGIEAFTALTHLNCWGNQLTSLDVSQNTNLNVLYCYDNYLTNLDVSQNTAFTITVNLSIINLCSIILFIYQIDICQH